MKVAYWPGCVSRGFTPELHGSMAKVAPLLDIELVELDRANCCGAGVIAEHSQELADTLNARTFALAQQEIGRGAELMMNICSTCQGAQTECQERLDANAEYREHVNGTLAGEGLTYEQGIVNKNFLWLLVEEIGLDELRARVKRPLTDLRVGPFYGCYIVRPTDRLGDRRRAARATLPRAGHRGARRHRHRLRGLAQVLRLPDHHDEQGGLAQAGRPPPRRRGGRRRRLPRHAVPAVPPEPRPAAAARRARQIGRELDMPVLHLPQLVGLALGLEPKELGLAAPRRQADVGDRLVAVGRRGRRRAGRGSRARQAARPPAVPRRRPQRAGNLVQKPLIVRARV